MHSVLSESDMMKLEMNTKIARCVFRFNLSKLRCNINKLSIDLNMNLKIYSILYTCLSKTLGTDLVSTLRYAP